MIVHILFAFCLLGSSNAFLPTRLNFDDPELQETFCPEQMTSPTINLKAITREGIRREIINLFNDDPPAGADPGFKVEETASLSEMFRQYYGASSSPTRFYSAVNAIAWANADMDSMESTKYDPKYHFDSEQIAEGQALLSERHNIIVSSILYNQSYSFARQQIGYSVHAIQDFYSHTNWYELGNTDILEGLALPGFFIPGVADESEVTCTSCSSSSGSCINNVITSAGLTSGYYEYDIPGSESFIIEKPSSKCSHGGSLDTSRTKDPQGGINKASSSPCFSPHFYNHEAVAELATQATQYYFSQIRFAVGNDRFKFLFDLYQGSALVIVMDTTGSMGDEIRVVQQQVALIVDTAPADLYILVPYNDPAYGPVTRTSNSDEFLDAVNGLTASGGGDLEEMVWSALQLALLETPDYSTLYLFTDAGGIDYQLMDGDIALAQEKNIICTVIYSYSNSDPTGPPYTDDTDYMNLAAVTGGEFILIDDFDIENVVSILGDGIESSLISVAIRRDIEGLYIVPALVDDTFSALQIVLSGDVTTAFIIAADSTNYNLLDQASLAGVATINAYSANIKDITFETPAIGMWYIETDGIGNYSVFANGDSTLGYLMEFTEVDTRPPRPNYRLISGQPIAGLSYYAETVLVGWIENEVDIVTTLVLLDDKGNVLSEVENTEPVDDEFYIKTEALPEQRFYVGVNGQLKNGNEFIRLYETLITPAKVAVGVDLSLSNLSAPPGTVLTTVFIALNSGPDATYDYFAVDDKLYVTDFSPKSSLILSGQTEAVEVTITIPIDAVPWTQSTVIVTASSRLLSYDVNSAFAYVIVLPVELDTIAPTCTPQSEPDCTGYQSSETCDDGTWMVTAIISDSESELVNVYTQPANNDTNLIVEDYDEGQSFDAVLVTLTVSCCITELDIIGVDAQGNIGTCNYDMGVLDGVLTFEVIDAGPDWILLEWTVSSVRPDLDKYRLITDGGDIINDIRCFELTCQFTVTFLSACTEYDFELIPYFDELDNGDLTPGASAYTTGTTTDVVPNAPTNGQIMMTTPDVIVSWDAPTNDQCIVLYEVCYTGNGIRTCQTTPLTSLVIDSYEFCTSYTIEISSQTLSGLSSDPFVMISDSVDGVPGPPTNFHVVTITAYLVHLTWDAPLENASCVFDYSVRWKDITGLMRMINEEELGEYEATLYPLVPCTDYEFSVWANSPQDVQGAPAYTYDSSDEIQPSRPGDLTVTPDGIDSIVISWIPGSSICVDHYELCWQPENGSPQCTALNGTSFTISNLQSCTRYSITVAAVSPDGVLSQAAFAIAATDDEVPGPMRNLAVIDVSNYTITIGYDLPLEHPQCVNVIYTRYTDLYNNEIIALDSNTLTFELHMDKMVEDFDYISTQERLEACTEYAIAVWGESPHGLVAVEATTSTTTLEGVPSAVVDLQGFSTTSTSITLHWTEPLENSRCAVRYTILWISEFGAIGNDVLVTVPPQFDFVYTMMRLLSGTIYNIGVSPVTELGTSGTVSNTVIQTIG